MFAWWAADVECASAIVRRQRAGALPAVVVEGAFARLNALQAGWHEVEPSEDVREFVCLDDRLLEAARREGFAVSPSPARPPAAPAP